MGVPETITPNRPQLPVLLAPTASGKTELLLQLLEEIPRLHIVMVDSRKLYRELEIGTNKPPKAVRKHFSMIDHISITETYNAMRFHREAEQAIEQKIREGYRILVAGGTPLYFYALFQGLFSAPSPDPDLRAHLLERWQRGEDLYAELRRVDPETAAKVNPQDWIRITRALEVYYQTGQPISVLRKTRRVQPKFSPIYYGLLLPREVLRRRIEERVDRMIQAGLVEEVQDLLARFPPESPGFRTIGYRELLEYLSGKTTLAEAIRKIKRNTKVYMRRQIYFMRKLGPVTWFTTPKDVYQRLKTVLETIPSRTP